MLRAWAAAMSNPMVRAGLVLLGVPLTLVLGFFAVLGTSAMLAESNFPAGVLGVGGLIGIAGAWMRLVVPGHKLRASPGLLWGTAFGLVVGMVIAAWMTFWLLYDLRTVLPWLAACAFVIGVFLLGATVGERWNAP